MKEFKCIHQAAKLPPEWNELAENYFQQTEFLRHTEKYNFCHQRYYLCVEAGRLLSAATVYSLNLDILTYLKVKSPLRMHVVGIPCSVSCPGIFGESQALVALKNHIFSVEKGFVLVLNLKEKPLDRLHASGRTLPTLVLTNHFASWPDYIASFRSNYRRRINHINKPCEELRFEKKKCAEFTETMYQFYLEVYQRSSGKLEKLNFDFFRHLPEDFCMTVCLKNEDVIGWSISLSDQNTHYFFLGGIDYSLNKTYNTYFRLLSSTVRDGIENKSAYIDLGQTAEIAKMRMGGKPLPLYMEAHHSNFILNRLLRLAGRLLEYKRKLENAHPLKEESK